MPPISAFDFMRAYKELRETCPSRAFPAIHNNCWVDSTMYGLTYAPDIGRALRAALLGCLENLEAGLIANTDEFYARVETWGLTPIWKTYVTRMLLYFLLQEKAVDELTCPLVSRWVEDFRKRTYEIAGKPVAPVGGLVSHAISAILTALSVDEDIVLEYMNSGDTYHFYGKDYTLQPTKPLTGYEARIRHIVVKGGSIGHVVVAFVCGRKLWLFDNNFGLFEFSKLSALPTDFSIAYDKVEIDGKWVVNKLYYRMKVGNKSQEVTKSFGDPKDSRIKARKREEQTVDGMLTLYTRGVYDRVRKGEDILATMLGAPTAKRLTATSITSATPIIEDVYSRGRVEMSSRSSRSSHSSRRSTDSKGSASAASAKEKGRLTKFASCVREMAATAPYKRSMLFNAPDWKVPEVEQLSLMSSKFRTLLETIKKVDEADMKKHGRMFKHFIFTDLRSGAYGAKAIGTFLAANGYELLFKAEKGFRRRKTGAKDGEGKPVYRMEPTKKLKITLGTHQPVEGGSNRVGLLQGNPLWKSPVGVDVRKQMLSIFNGRPDNIHGEQIRFMVLDSKFKEGIDLYDVKYVHLMEPAITEADLKQAIGRATRYCGQRGLQFVPNVGWKLEVFLYKTQFANGYPFRQSGHGKTFDAHKYMMAHSGLDLGLLEMTRNLTVLAIKSAVDYDLTYKINNFKMQTEIHDLTSLDAAIVLSVNPQTGGVTSVKPAAGFDRSKCLPRSNKFFPFTVRRIREAFKVRGIRAGNVDRKGLCRMLEEHEEVMQDLLTGRKVSVVRPELPTSSPLLSAPSAKDSVPASPATSAGTAESMVGLPRTPYYELFPVPEKPQRLSKEEIEEMPDLADFFAAHELAAEADSMAQKASFAEFQEFIRQRYAEYRWAAPVVKSACDAVMPMGQPVQFSQSQDFVRHYLTPASPFAGLLAWHSVGTGKTCTAVATATSEFEKAGYSILWVTRNSLMADVWKNVFGAVCSIPVQEYVRAGKKIPARMGTRKRLLSKAWFDPISYRTLQNALVPVQKGSRKGQVTKLGQILRQRNGTDPLRKTFLIIDEVHKLLDGDLKASEMADFDKIAAAIHNSYKVSGKDAVKVLLMTATPITDNPEGLFKLLNLLIPQESQRLPTVEAFRAKYTKADGSITAEGEAFFQEKAKGLISYLNREFDPSAFAQPDFKQVKVVASGADLASDRAILQECMMAEEAEELDCDLDSLKEDLQEALEDLEEEDLNKKEMAARKKTLKADYKKLIDDCKARIKSRKAVLKEKNKEVAVCVAEKAKTRKKAWKYSQQKAVKKCFGKAFYGEPPSFTTIGELKKMIKEGVSANSTATTAISGTPTRSMSPNAARYMKPKKTRKVKKTKAKSRNSRSNND